MTGMTTSIEPVRMELVVPLAQEAAFDLFTSRISTWWPLSTHKVSKGSGSRCSFEPRAGGRIYESDDSGAEFDWGMVRAYERPTRLVFSWHPERDPSTAQEVEIRFTPVADGTRLDLEHRGWEALGDQAAQMRDAYEHGWGFVLGQCYRDAAKAESER